MQSNDISIVLKCFTLSHSQSLFSLNICSLVEQWHTHWIQCWHTASLTMQWCVSGGVPGCYLTTICFPMTWLGLLLHVCLLVMVSLVSHDTSFLCLCSSGKRQCQQICNDTDDRIFSYHPMTIIYRGWLRRWFCQGLCQFSDSIYITSKFTKSASLKYQEKCRILQCISHAKYIHYIAMLRYLTWIYLDTTLSIIASTEENQWHGVSFVQLHLTMTIIC